MGKNRQKANLTSNNLITSDITNDRIGINSTTPTATLNVVGVVSATSFYGDGSNLTAPEMMLLPYMSEPATGSRIPSISTGGAATKAVMKQIVAASRVGIIRTPNQPTYRRLLVLVTQEQNSSQVDAPCWREITELAIVFEKG
jgi:hypothetical protein